MTQTSRGLIRSSRPVLKNMPVEQAAQNAIEKMRLAPAGSSEWRNRMDWARGLARGGFDDYGRRLHTEKGIAKAGYVARVSFQALKRGKLPEGRSRTMFENSIKAIYADLGNGGGQ